MRPCRPASVLKLLMLDRAPVNTIRIASACLAIALGLVLAACSPHKVAYRGHNLIERESGINVTAIKESGIVAVTSSRYHYSIILPYFDEWDFSWKSGQLLSGKSGGVNLNLTAIRSEDSPSAHLKKLRKVMSGPGVIPGMESMRLIRHNGERVLVTVVDGAKATDAEALSGVKHLNIFSLRKRKDVLYMLHLSTPYMEADGAKGLREEFLDYVTSGFDVNYMRDVGELEDSLELGSTRRRGISRQR